MRWHIICLWGFVIAPRWNLLHVNVIISINNVCYGYFKEYVINVYLFNSYNDLIPSLFPSVVLRQKTTVLTFVQVYEILVYQQFEVSQSLLTWNFIPTHVRHAGGRYNNRENIIHQFMFQYSVVRSCRRQRRRSVHLNKPINARIPTTSQYFDQPRF